MLSQMKWTESEKSIQLLKDEKIVDVSHYRTEDLEKPAEDSCY